MTEPGFKPLSLFLRTLRTLHQIAHTPHAWLGRPLPRIFFTIIYFICQRCRNLGWKEHAGDKVWVLLCLPSPHRYAFPSVLFGQPGWIRMVISGTQEYSCCFPVSNILGGRDDLESSRLFHAAVQRVVEGIKYEWYLNLTQCRAQIKGIITIKEMMKVDAPQRRPSLQKMLNRFPFGERSCYGLVSPEKGWSPRFLILDVQWSHGEILWKCRLLWAPPCFFDSASHGWGPGHCISHKLFRIFWCGCSFGHPFTGLGWWTVWQLDHRPHGHSNSWLQRWLGTRGVSLVEA